jgi:predicted MFS family arabinose efflux permease
MELSNKFFIYIYNRLGYKIYSLLFSGMALASIIGLLISTFILPEFGYSTVFGIFGFMNLTSLFLLNYFDEEKA